jgi:hypothetical protein
MAPSLAAANVPLGTVIVLAFPGAIDIINEQKK